MRTAAAHRAAASLRHQFETQRARDRSRLDQLHRNRVAETVGFARALADHRVRTLVVTEVIVADRASRHEPIRSGPGELHEEPGARHARDAAFERRCDDLLNMTFVALRLSVDNWRWADVPIYVRVGKRLPKSGTEISVHFKKAPQVLFNRESQSTDQNVLVIRIQPDEGISLRMQAKVPGTSFRIESVKMDFHYGTSFGKASPEAYERLLLDVLVDQRTQDRGDVRRRDALRPPR